MINRKPKAPGQRSEQAVPPDNVYWWNMTVQQKLEQLRQELRSFIDFYNDRVLQGRQRQHEAATSGFVGDPDLRRKDVLRIDEPEYIPTHQAFLR